MEPVPAWVYPSGGFTAETFLRLRGLPKRTQLIDGGLVFTGPQTSWHSRVVSLLVYELDRQAPAELRAAREMAVRLDDRQVPTPDVIVLSSEAFDRDDQANHFEADEVVLAVEAVSADSADRDRDTKPHLYARAGIEHFWRIEDDDGRAVVYTYTRNPAGQYAITGIHHDRLVLSVPYDVEIDLTKVGARRS
nr:Uma2 family endonuclease [Jiangella mangrovi]